MSSFSRHSARVTLALLLLAACGGPVPLARTEERDGLRYRSGQETPFTGTLITPRDSATQVQVTVTFKDGLRDGRAEGRYPNKALAFAEQWVAGKREGLREEWDSLGRLQRSQTFTAGLLEGVMKDYHFDSTVVAERPMLGGKEEGLVKTWYPSGARRSISEYKGGRLNGRLQMWYEDGSDRYDGTFLDGKPDGVVTEWHLGGRMKSRITWKAGVPDGEFSRWYSNGKLHMTGRYKAGDMKELKAWDQEGKPLAHPEIPPPAPGPHEVAPG